LPEDFPGQSREARKNHSDQEQRSHFSCFSPDLRLCARRGGRELGEQPPYATHRYR
jgi:hypothetical protein